VDVDREKVKTMWVQLSDVFDALQAYLGSFYTNDFNRFGRTSQVNVQADDRFRNLVLRHAEAESGGLLLDELLPDHLLEHDQTETVRVGRSAGVLSGALDVLVEVSLRNDRIAHPGNDTVDELRSGEEPGQADQENARDLSHDSFPGGRNSPV
jgi:hypothetical protein